MTDRTILRRNALTSAADAAWREYVRLINSDTKHPAGAYRDARAKLDRHMKRYVDSCRRVGVKPYCYMA